MEKSPDREFRGISLKTHTVIKIFCWRGGKGTWWKILTQRNYWNLFLQCNVEASNKKVKNLSKIKKLDSFFDFRTKSRKHKNRGMHFLALILGFEGWKFAGYIIMNHIIDFLLIKLDMIYPNTLIISTGNRSGFAQDGVWLLKAWTLNIFIRVTANSANCCGFFIIWYQD
jgi:hypothetical protein